MTDSSWTAPALAAATSASNAVPSTAAAAHDEPPRSGPSLTAGSRETESDNRIDPADPTSYRAEDVRGDLWLDEPSTDAVVQGLARNRAAPVDVLLRLLDECAEAVPYGLRRHPALPPAVIEAMLHHPAPRVRGALATHPHVDPECRERLLTDPEWRVRVRALGSSGQRPLSDDALVRLLTSLDDPPPPDTPFGRVELLDELFFSMRYDRHLIRLAATHPRPGIREKAARVLNGLDEPFRQALLNDESPKVRQTATETVAYFERVREPADLPDNQCHAFWEVLQRPLSRALVDHVLASGDPDALSAIGSNPTTPPDVVETLLRHPDPKVRRGLTDRADLTNDQLARLVADPSAEVRTAVSTHPGLTEQQRAGIDIDLTVLGYGLPGHTDVNCLARYTAGPPPDLADSHRWARSVNPLLRRRAACDPRLPVELVAVLAADPDLGVRVRLALHHPAAPPELLLCCYLEYHCCGRDQLSKLPQFPTKGLARFAEDPDPAVRRLVALDPNADPPLVNRMATDPDAAVRQAMASCPRLPAPRITALLDDPELAESAASNPALPVQVMRERLAPSLIT